MWQARETNIIVIGSGIAGLLFSLLASRYAHVTIITESELGNGNSILAQGGVAVPLGKDDHVTLHIEDTLITGQGLSDPLAVKTLILGAEIALDELVHLGVAFDCEPNGHFILGREGAHSRNRIIHAGGDATGKNVIEALITNVRNQPNITILEHTQVIDLLVQYGECDGVVVQENGNKPFVIHASVVVLASGGLGQLYPYTTNKPHIYGAGIAMVYLAGAKVRDLEFIQFHPTALNVNKSPMPLISEAVRGEGAFLVNDQGKPFMREIHPMKDLAPRDVVARAIFNEMSNGRDVYLDARDIRDFEHRFPTISTLCIEAEIHPVHDLIPVTPAAHYMMGGLVTDLDGRTSIKRLYAIGEVASTGVNGANRLASNSLLEGLVFAQRAAEAIQEEFTKIMITRMYPIYSFEQLQQSNLMKTEKLLHAVQQLMWEHVGIVRNEVGLQRAKQKINEWLSELRNEPVPTTELYMLTTAKLVIEGAIWRRESRGAHYRSDYPISLEQYQSHYIQGGSNESDFSTKSVTASTN